MRSLWTLVLFLGAGPVFGLSCKPPNFGEDFNRIAVDRGLDQIFLINLLDIGRPGSDVHDTRALAGEGHRGRTADTFGRPRNEHALAL